MITAFFYFRLLFLHKFVFMHLIANAQLMPKTTFISSAPTEMLNFALWLECV